MNSWIRSHLSVERFRPSVDELVALLRRYLLFKAESARFEGDCAKSAYVVSQLGGAVAVRRSAVP